jgi:hypothetical protein
VVDGLHPGGEQRVQLHQVVQFPAGADLDQELLAHGAEESFDLAPAGGLAWFGVDQLDTQAGAGAQQLLVDERRPVVDIDRGRDAAGGQPGAQRGLQPDGVLRAGPSVPDQEPAVVVEEGEQDRLAPAHGRAVQRVTGPSHVRCLGFEPAKRLRGLPVGAGRELPPDEVPLQRAFRWRPPAVRAQDRRHLRRGPLGYFLLQRHRQVEHLGRGARGHPARAGHQRVEPTAAPIPDPPVNRRPGCPHRRAERAGMFPRGQRPDQPAALLGAQLWVGGIADQAIPEQPHGPGPLRPDLIFAGMACGHRRLLTLDRTDESRGWPKISRSPRVSSC